MPLGSERLRGECHVIGLVPIELGPLGPCLVRVLWGAGSAQEDRRWPQLKEVIVVSKTHFDIGYTDLASRVVDRYRTTMADQALKLVDESRDLPPDQKFSWTLAGWPMAQILWPGQTPQRREHFLAAMREGRMVPQALAFTTHTESLDLEDLVRGYRFSVEMARLAGKPLPTAAKMTDVTSHTRVTSTILAHAGVRFFHLGCNEGCSHPDVPLLYWWEGPDGSRVLTMCSSAYGSSLSPPRDWPHKAWLYMWMTGDNHGPPSTEEVNALFARARQELPGVRVRFGQMSDFAEAILREKPELPVVRGDMPDTWIHGIGSMPIETQLAHTTRPRIAALESLDTLLGIWGVPRSSAANVVRDAYENTLLFGEHTWGPDVGRYAGYTYGEQWKRKLAAGDYRFLLEGFAQKRAYAHKAAESVEPAIAERMAALAKAVNVDGRRVVVFNPLPWERNGVVDVSWAGDIQALTDVASGEVVPAAVEGRATAFRGEEPAADGLPNLQRVTAAIPEARQCRCEDADHRKRAVPRDARSSPLWYPIDRSQEDGPRVGQHAVTVCSWAVPLRAIRRGPKCTVHGRLRPLSDVGRDDQPRQAQLTASNRTPVLRRDRDRCDGDDAHRCGLGDRRARGRPSRHHPRRYQTARHALHGAALARLGMVHLP